MKNTGFDRRYEAFMADVDKWRNRHGITRKQAISILVENDPEDFRHLYQYMEFNEFCDEFYVREPLYQKIREQLDRS